MKIKDHDTWCMSPKLYNLVEKAVEAWPIKDTGLSPFGIKLISNQYFPENRLALMKDGSLVQMIEVDWGTDGQKAGDQI